MGGLGVPPRLSAARQSALMLLAAVAIVGGAWLAAPTVSSPGREISTFEPADASVVLERLPGGARESLRLRAAREGGGALDDAQALRTARQHLEAARTLGDPREAGRARAVLARWDTDPAPPAEAVLIRAAVAQHLHAFEAALADLDALLAREPDDLPARWLRASVRRTVGRIDGAQDDCTAVDRLAGGRSPSAAACIADLASLRGDREAGTRLDTYLRTRPTAPTERGWLALVRAEIAERDGRVVDATQLYRAAIANGADGPYARVALADRLLADGRARDAEVLLREAPPTDAVLLRRALALRALGDASARDVVASLQARFEAARRRGEDDRHLREQAQLALELDADAPRALELAARNWAAQKEPADAMLMVRAAQASGRPEAAAPVVAFVEANRLDARAWGVR